MYSIKLVINTGIHWMDVVDLGLYAISLKVIMDLGVPDLHRYKLAGDLVPGLQKVVDDLSNHLDEYKRYEVDDLLGARDYLSKLLAACKYHPGCEVRVETI